MSRRQTIRALATLTVAAMAIAACGSSPSDDAAATADESTTTADVATTVTTLNTTTFTTLADNSEGELFPDVIDANARLDGDGTWSFDATLSSPYDTAERYADAWRVVGPDGAEYGIRVLTHDHASEQPFTRSQSGIAIPDDVDEVTVQGRDQVSGWGGQTVVVELDRG